MDAAGHGPVPTHGDSETIKAQTLNTSSIHPINPCRSSIGAFIDVLSPSSPGPERGMCCEDDEAFVRRYGRAFVAGVTALIVFVPLTTNVSQVPLSAGIWTERHPN